MGERGTIQGWVDSGRVLRQSVVKTLVDSFENPGVAATAPTTEGRRASVLSCEYGNAEEPGIGQLQISSTS